MGRWYRGRYHAPKGKKGSPWLGNLLGVLMFAAFSDAANNLKLKEKKEKYPRTLKTIIMQF